MNWRLPLTLALLAAAIVSGWSVWKHRPVSERGPEEDATGPRCTSAERRGGITPSKWRLLREMTPPPDRRLPGSGC